MEFNGQYLTYEDYKGLGGTLNLMPFNLLEFEARKKVDARSQMRLKNVEYENMPDEVKICMFNLINSIEGYAESKSKISANGNIASENIDGYSVSFITPDKIKDVVESKNVEINNIIEDYLYGVIVNGEHVIYCGGL